MSQSVIFLTCLINKYSKFLTYQLTLLIKMYLIKMYLIKIECFAFTYQNPKKTCFKSIIRLNTYLKSKFLGNELIAMSVIR